MAQTRPIRFGIQAAQSFSTPWLAQRAVNLYAEISDAKAVGRSPLAMVPLPGLTLFTTAGDGPCRGAHVMAGVLYVVSGPTLYSVTSAGTATSLGSIAGTNRVGMADNGTQLCIVQGSNGYVYTVAGGLVAISDADFPGADTVDFLDQYGIFSKPSSGQFFISALDDFTDIDALDFATAESAPDDLYRVYVHHRELLLFGTETIEQWYDSGATDFPFERIPGGIFEHGLVAPFAVADIDNTVYWLSDDNVVYALTGQAPKRVSTHPIEERIDDVTQAAIDAAFMFTYTDRGHKFVVLTLPDEATLVYDIATDLWHERLSYDSEAVDLGRWRANGHARVFGKNLITDYQDGSIYELDKAAFTENSLPMRAIMQSPPQYDPAGRRMTDHKLQLEMETGVGITTGQGSDPKAMLRWSDDSGRTWSPELWRDLQAIGDYRYRVPPWRRLGQYYNRVYELTVTDPVKRVLIDASVRRSVSRT